MPLLIAQGRNDTRVPMQQAQEIRRAVAPNGNPVWYVVYDDGHGFTKRVNDDFNQYCWILFVQTYLLNGN
jgi:predicted esterase